MTYKRDFDALNTLLQHDKLPVKVQRDINKLEAVAALTGLSMDDRYINDMHTANDVRIDYEAPILANQDVLCERLAGKPLASINSPYIHSFVNCDATNLTYEIDPCSQLMFSVYPDGLRFYIRTEENTHLFHVKDDLALFKADLKHVCPTPRMAGLAIKFSFACLNILAEQAGLAAEQYTPARFTLIKGFSSAPLLTAA